MSNYTERAPRIEAQFPIEFVVDSEVVRGDCMNISESGLYAVFALPLDLWTTGELSLHVGDGCVGLKARVVRSTGKEAGLAFVLTLDSDRDTVRNLVETARLQARYQPPVGTAFIA